MSIIELHEDNPFKDIAASLGGLEGLDDFLTLYNLPDDEFAMLSPLLREGLTRSLQNPIERSQFLKEIKEFMSPEDAQSLIDGISELVPELMEAGLSEPKIDFFRFLFLSIANAVLESSGGFSPPVQVLIEKSHPDAKIPTQAHMGDAGWDLYAIEDVIIAPGETKPLLTGIKVEVPNGYAMLIHPRSGLSAGTKLRLANAVAVIDSGYRGEIKVILENISALDAFEISKGDRIAQARFVEVPRVHFIEVSEVGESERGTGGLGSSGR